LEYDILYLLDYEKNVHFSFLHLFWGAVLGFITLARQVLYHLSHAPQVPSIFKMPKGLSRRACTNEPTQNARWLSSAREGKGEESLLEALSISDTLGHSSMCLTTSLGSILLQTYAAHL
jgi:hypothetical protein